MAGKGCEPLLGPAGHIQGFTQPCQASACQATFGVKGDLSRLQGLEAEEPGPRVSSQVFCRSTIPSPALHPASQAHSGPSG